MENYLNTALGDLKQKGLQVQKQRYGAVIPRKFLDAIREGIVSCDKGFTLGELSGPTRLQEPMRNHFFEIKNSHRLDHQGATYRIGTVNTGLRNQNCKPSDKNLEALAMFGMIVKENSGNGLNYGEAGCLTMLDETGLFTSTKLIRDQLAIVSALYPPGSNQSFIYDPSDLQKSKARLRESEQALPGIDQFFVGFGLREIADFSFETVLKSIQHSLN